jgi:cell cycle checkpoint control protein RAD9A
MVKYIEFHLNLRLGKTQLVTELMISAAEFENYNIYEPPTTLAFQLREFNVSQFNHHCRFFL